MKAGTTQDDIAYLSAVDQIQLYRSRELSPVEVLQAQIARANALADSINAFTWRFNDAALAAAQQAEARYLGKGDDPRPLDGVTLAMKEHMAVEGQPLTDCSHIYADFVADHTSPLAERVIAAGAIVHARTTQPEFACAAITQSPLFGVTRNPWNRDYDVGGSSGGAGAALAAGLTTLAAGSDIAGSIRIPAACCGVVGYKPPYGRVPMEPPFNLDHYCHQGPMGRTVADCALLENVISGPSPIDIASLREHVTIPLDPPGVEGLRIALSLDFGGWEPEEDVRRNTRAAAEALRAAGAIVEEVELVLERELVMQAARTHFATIFGPSVANLIAEHREKMAGYAVAFGEAAVLDGPGQYLGGLEIEGQLAGRINAVLGDYDALLCPTLSIAALPVDTPWVRESANDWDKLWLDHLMTIPFNIASRCPVLSVPSGFASTGVPTGVQLVGRTYEDEMPFRLGAALERAGLWDYGRVRPETSLTPSPSPSALGEGNAAAGRD